MFLQISSDDGEVSPRRDARLLRLVAHLSRESLDGALDALGEVGVGEDLIVDASEMTGYDGLARQRFVEWNAANRKAIRRLAIVTSNPLWGMVIRAMSLASGREMRPFATRAEAAAWMHEPD